MSTRFQLINSAHDVPETDHAASVCHSYLPTYRAPAGPAFTFITRAVFITLRSIGDL